MPTKQKKTWREKLLDSKDLPKVSKIEGKMSKRWGEGTCAIPAPIEVDEVMQTVPKGKLITTKEIQKAVAKIPQHIGQAIVASCFFEIGRAHV